MLIKKPAVILFLMLMSTFGEAQVAIGEWREHLSYKKGVAVCKAGTRVYCATFPSLFYYETTDNSINKFSKVEGASDLEANVLKYSEKHNTVIVGYNNGNIDLIVNNEIINVPDVKRSFIQGDKSINEILLHDDIAYLSTGFGIIALNIARKEIKETYNLGPGGTFLQVNESCIKNDTLYAATKEGIFIGDLNSNLVDFQNWSKIPSLPTGNYNTIVNFNSELLTNFRFEGGWEQDTLYSFKNNIWSKKAIVANYKNDNIADLNVSSDGKLLIAFDFRGEVLDSDYKPISSIWQYGDQFNSVQPSEIIVDGSSYWIADQQNALIHRRDKFSHSVYLPTGPAFSDAWGMDYQKGVMWLTTGTLTPNMRSSWSNKGIAKFENEEWHSYFGGTVFDSLRDIHSVAIHPDDPKHIFAASFFGGLLEFKDGQRVKIYDETNSEVQSIDLFPWRGVGGLVFDNSKNLWMTNSGLSGQSITNPLLVYDKDKNWHAFPLNGWLNNTAFASKIIVDKNGNKWMAAYLKGLIVFNENGTLANTSDDQQILLSVGENDGNLPNNEVHAMAQDADGKMWIGTSTGLAVINDPHNVFTSNGVKAEKVIIEIDGNANYLLGDEVITSIKIDAGDRKWVGTQGSGVYLMSAEMQTEIHHFNTLNSPLLSDIVYDIEIDENTGEVFFSTDKGLVSYMGGATNSESYTGPLYAFPNPVPPNYSGNIGIKGLVNNAEVKITDLTGNVVFETMAEGGTATWNGLRLDGRKVQSGVYIVHSSNEDGSDTQITKILFLN